MLDLEVLYGSETDFGLVVLAGDTITIAKKSAGVQTKGKTKSPIWLSKLSPLGNKCLYIQDLGGPKRLRLMDLATRSELPLATIPADHDFMDCCFAGVDSTVILYSLGRLSLRFKQLFMIQNASGNEEGKDITPPLGLLAFDHIAQLPDSMRIVFQSPLGDDSDNSSVWIYDFTNKDLKRFTQHAKPVVSPNGEIVVMSQIKKSHVLNFEYRLVAYSPNQDRFIVDMELDAWAHLFAPDSQRILAFERHDKAIDKPIGEWILMDLLSGQQKKINLGPEWHPLAWSKNEFIYLFNARKGLLGQFLISSEFMRIIGHDMEQVLLTVA